MAELATIARPYAEGLFKAYGAQAESALSWLDPMALIAARPEVLQFAASPKATPEQIYGLVADAAQVALDERAGNFLRTIIASDRLAALPTVATLFRSRVDALKGVSEAVVHSAYALDDAAVQDLHAVLQGRFGVSLKLRVVIDDSLIGGVRVVVGDEVLDLSVHARLEQMRAALTA